MFTLELLQAINDWQNEGFGLNKQDIGKRIKDNSSTLNEKFKKIYASCYRRVDFIGIDIFKIGVNLKLPEIISSWTISQDVAMNFMGGIPPLGYHGLIFELQPKDTGYEVIINLDELYKDNDFNQACIANQNNIVNYKDGIGRFGNHEQEIIIEVSELHISKLWAYGGYSAPIETLAEMHFQHKPSPDELIQFKIWFKQNITIDDYWVKGTEKNRIVALHIKTAADLIKGK